MRVAEEVGNNVGYNAGISDLEDCTSGKTVIKYIKDGTLLRESFTVPNFLLSITLLTLDIKRE